MSATMAIGSARANRVKVQPGNAWARRSIFSPASSDGDDASTTSSLSDAMSTASGYSDQIEEATARRATGSATEGTSGGASGGGHTMGGASLSSPGIVLSDDQTAELREVLNASNSLGEVRLIPQSDGGVSIAHSLSQG